LRLVYKFKAELLSTEMEFWRRAARIYRPLKVRHEVITERMGVTQRMLERL
jgi:hypothetical protein